MTKKVVDKGGRPSKLTEERTKKLEDIFKVGGTVLEACSFAGISTTAYYEWINKNESLRTKMEAAQHYADVVAKNLVSKAIIEDEDLSTAKWWLEKREFSQPQSLQQINVGEGANFQIVTTSSEEEFKKKIDG